MGYYLNHYLIFQTLQLVREPNLWQSKIEEKAQSHFCREASMSQRYNFQVAGLIFFGVPPPKKPVEGGGSVKGEKRNS
jgi:hypothetical protein